MRVAWFSSPLPGYCKLDGKLGRNPEPEMLLAIAYHVHELPESQTQVSMRTQRVSMAKTWQRFVLLQKRFVPSIPSIEYDFKKGDQAAMRSENFDDR